MEKNNNISKLSGQLAAIVSSCPGYAEIKREILSLLGSYVAADALWGGKECSNFDESGNMQVLSIGTQDQLLLYRDDTSFGAEEKVLGELCYPLLVLLQRLEQEECHAENHRQVQLVKTAINTLSFTELEVVLKIFEVLNATEGILVTGKIADGLGITRSVVVNALRKLESASIIETRSLGMKGTYIKVLNPLWIGELRKLRG